MDRRLLIPIFLFLLLTVGIVKAQYTWYIGVFSLTEKDEHGCPIDLYNISYVEMRNSSGIVCSGQPNTYVEHGCQYGEYPNYSYVGYYYLNCSNLQAGNYSLYASATGYQPQNKTVEVYSTRYYNFFLSPLHTYKLTVNVYANATPVINAQVCAFFSNGTSAYDLSYNVHCYYTSSSGNAFFYLHEDDYYFTVVATGYPDYTSPIFTLDSDKTYDVNLTGTCEPSVVIICNDSLIEDGEKLGINVRVKCNSAGGYLAIYRELQPDTGASYDDFTVLINGSVRTSENPFYITVTPHFCGNVEAWVKVQDGNGVEFESNKCYLVNNRSDCETPPVIPTTIPPEQSTPITSINTTEWEELGYGWATPIFTPFFILTIFAVILSAFVASRFGSYSGLVFSVSLILLISVFTLLGLYPAWLSIVFIIIAGFITAMLLMKIVKGG